MFKYNQIIVKNRFLFLRFSKTMHIGSFAQNNFNSCPRYSRSIFGPMNVMFAKNRKSGIVLSQNRSNQLEKMYSFFFVSTKRMHIGSFAQNTSDRCPQYSRNICRPIKRYWKNRKSGIVLWSNSIKST